MYSKIRLSTILLKATHTQKGHNMSAILEEGIGYGGNDTKSDPRPTTQSSPSVNLPIRTEKWTFDEVQKEMLNDGKKYISDQVNTMVEKEVQRRNSEIVANKKIEEVRQMMHTFKERVANYPKHMSYEGSMVLCVLLSMKRVAAVNMRSIPLVDQTLIKSLLPKEVDVSGFDVKFDDNKDFILIFNPQDNENITLTLFNTIAHPRPEDLTPNSDVKVEADGERIAVGDKIKMNKRTIQKLFGHEQSEHSVEKEEPSQRRQVASNRNAYEIRADVLQMALDWSIAKNKSGLSEEEVLQTAKKFYAFVENRR